MWIVENCNVIITRQSGQRLMQFYTFIMYFYWSECGSQYKMNLALLVENKIRYTLFTLKVDELAAKTWKNNLKLNRICKILHIKIK